MTNYQYIVLPVSGSPYKVYKKKDEDELSFLQDKVDGYIEQIRNPIRINPNYIKEWEWVNNLFKSKARYTLYANENGRAECNPSEVLTIEGWSGDYPLMGDAVIKMTKKQFDKVDGMIIE